MIIIEITSKNNEIVSIEMNGHSGYAENGKDIVCAGVSSLVYAALNSFNWVTNGEVVFAGIFSDAARIEETAIFGKQRYETK